MRTGRFEAFSDGVFAIAITILVLELSVPAAAGDDLWEAFLAQWPSYLAYLVGFSTIGATWLAHVAITHFLTQIDTLLVRFNLLLLMLVSFIPFPTRLVAEHVDDLDAERVAATLLGVNLLLVAVAVSSMWGYAVRRRLVDVDADPEEVHALTVKLTPGLAAYTAMIVLGLFLPLAAVFGYLAIALLLIIPFGHRSVEPFGT